jgi:hypothetical protein
MLLHGNNCISLHPRFYRLGNRDPFVMLYYISAKLGDSFTSALLNSLDARPGGREKSTLTSFYCAVSIAEASFVMLNESAID